MRADRRAGGDRARQRLFRDRRGGHRTRSADQAASEKFRHAAGRAVEPRRGRSAAQGVPHRQRRLRRAGPAGRPHLRGVAFRRHDRHVPVARQGARHPFRRARFGRQRGRSVDRRDLRGDARRSRHRRLRAVPGDDAEGAGAARLRAGGRQAQQAGAGLQARPLGGGARARGVAHRRARRRGRHRRHVPRRMRHRAGRYAGGVDRRLSAAGAGAGAAARPRTARSRRGHDDRRRRHHGGRSAGDARHHRAAADAADPGAHQGHNRRRGRARRHHRPHARRRAIQGDEGRARRADHRAGVRHGRGGGRLLGAVLSRPCGEADHRQRQRAETDRRVSGARSARCAGAARRGGRAELPHAGGLRRRGGGGVAAASRRGRSRCGLDTQTGGGKMLDELQAYALLRSCRRAACPSIALDARCDACARPALCLSRRGQGAVSRHRAQVRCRRRGVECSR